MRGQQQTTLGRSVSVDGIGVHSGEPVTLILEPAPAGTGIVFHRTGLPGDAVRILPARHEHVSATALCTTLGDAETGSVSTIEHLMAALMGLAIDNVVIRIDGPEVPICDGSSRAFVEAIEEAGVRQQSLPRRYLKVLKPVTLQVGAAKAEFLPARSGFRLETEILFDTPLIGRQSIAINVNARTFRRELSQARTFGFLKDVERLWLAGFARGASMDNSVVLADDRVLNAGGLRFADEFVRHKALDALGDLALAGMPIIGTYRSFCGGHRVNAEALQTLLADRKAWTVVEPALEAGADAAQGYGMRAGLVPALAPDR
jgi:UDP-3-O-[3-hydroxymyristoyl] N-acetylglucosamine deacetylase